MLEIKEMLLTPNQWSRPQRKLNKIKGVTCHWVANAKSTAAGNRNYFENLKNQADVPEDEQVYASAHYVVGLEGEVIHCIPDNEMAYHVGSKTYTQEALNKLSPYPNDCTIGIEMCHINWDGEFSPETYESTAQLCAKLLYKFDLTEENLWTHQQTVGWKNCPKWFVDHPDEWKKFKAYVGQKLQQLIKEDIVMAVSKYFKDIPQSMEWAVPEIDDATSKGIVKGKGDGMLDPMASVTRGECVVLIDRAVQYILSQMGK